MIQVKLALSKFTRRDFEFIKYLDPIIIPLTIELMARWDIAGYYKRITDGHRTLDQQYQLYLIGRPWLKGGKKGNAVTWVSGKGSMHTWGLAIDIAPMMRVSVLGYTIEWGDLGKLAPIAQELGFDWGFAIWGTDKPHFHYTGNLSTEEVTSGMKPEIPTFTPCNKPEALVRGFNRILQELNMVQYSLPFSPHS